MTHDRDQIYRELTARSAEASALPTEARLQWVADAVWEALGPDPVSWCGFYQPGEGDPPELILGPRRDRPACSPIGYHGVCGQAARRGEAVLVEDVRALGEDYIACDPHDRSELVVPLYHPGGSLFAVFDLDSRQVAAFTELDRNGVEALLQAVFPGLAVRR